MVEEPQIVKHGWELEGHNGDRVGIMSRSKTRKWIYIWNLILRAIKSQ